MDRCNTVFLWLPCSLLAVASLPTPAWAQATVPDSAASRYVGQTVTVEATVVDVFTPWGGTTFHNFGAADLKQTLKAVVFCSAAAPTSSEDP